MDIKDIAKVKEDVQRLEKKIDDLSNTLEKRIEKKVNDIMKYEELKRKSLKRG
jgi:hypothetical protein